MARVAQIGIAIGALGMMLTFMGLFPGVTGLEPTTGIGVVQIFVILNGFTLLILGALIYVKFTFYAFKKSTLLQQIGTRLALTGLVLAGLAALADVLGFGSHGATATAAVTTEDNTIFLGRLQSIAIIISFFISSLGVLIYALAGDQNGKNNDEDKENGLNQIHSNYVEE